MVLDKKHIAHLRTVIETGTAKPSMAHRARPDLEEYRAAGLSAKQWRWDLIHWLGLIPWLCEHVYPYANDDHIDTALRLITGTKS